MFLYKKHNKKKSKKMPKNIIFIGDKSNGA